MPAPCHISHGDRDRGWGGARAARFPRAPRQLLGEVPRAAGPQLAACQNQLRRLELRQGPRRWQGRGWHRAGQEPPGPVAAEGAARWLGAHPGRRRGASHFRNRFAITQIPSPAGLRVETLGDSSALAYNELLSKTIIYIWWNLNPGLPTTANSAALLPLLASARAGAEAAAPCPLPCPHALPAFPAFMHCLHALLVFPAHAACLHALPAFPARSHCLCSLPTHPARTPCPRALLMHPARTLPTPSPGDGSLPAGPRLPFPLGFNPTRKTQGRLPRSHEVWVQPVAPLGPPRLCGSGAGSLAGAVPAP